MAALGKVVENSKACSHRDGLSVKTHPDAIGMDQSDHADSPALPCQQESFSISSPIHQRSLFDQRHRLDSSQERPWRIVG